jgi:hypothetical protein
MPELGHLAFTYLVLVTIFFKRERSPALHPTPHLEYQVYVFTYLSDWVCVCVCIHT